jgi:hypothetical protein
MSRISFLALAAAGHALVSLSACGIPVDLVPGSGSAIEVADDVAPLTSGADDKLFTMTLTAGTESFFLINPISSLGPMGQMVNVSMVLAVKQSEQLEVPIDCVFQNKSKETGIVDRGDQFVCKESPASRWDTDAIGKPVTIKLRANKRFIVDDGMPNLIDVAQATWTPN